MVKSLAPNISLEATWDAPQFVKKWSKLPRSKLRGIHNGIIVMGAAAPKPSLAHSSRQQADGYKAVRLYQESVYK
jgi:hypothetical protein